MSAVFALHLIEPPPNPAFFPSSVAVKFFRQMRLRRVCLVRCSNSHDPRHYAPVLLPSVDGFFQRLALRTGNTFGIDGAGDS